MAVYDDKLVQISAVRPMTTDQIGEIVGCNGFDALTRLRGRRDLRVTLTGTLPHNGKRRGGPSKLYKIEKVQVFKGPYCCGYCEQQRQLTGNGEVK